MCIRDSSIPGLIAEDKRSGARGLHWCGCSDKCSFPADASSVTRRTVLAGCERTNERHPPGGVTSGHQ
eukprot:7415444-Alexandrium_andersonii.AAC.1